MKSYWVLILLLLLLLVTGYWCEVRRASMSFSTPEKDYWADFQDSDFVHIRAQMVFIEGQCFLKVAECDFWNSKKEFEKVKERIRVLEEKLFVKEVEVKK